MRKTALVAGILYLITFISVATLTLYGPVLKDPAYILSSGSDAGLRWGALIDVIVALAGIGTAITLYPVVRRQNETFALGFVTSRVIEGAMLLTGVVSLLSLASLHQVGAAAGADSTALLTSGASFVGTYNAAFLIGGTLMPAMNALLLGYLMYRSSLVPRLIPAIGLVGGVLMTSSVIGQILGINEKISVWSLIALLPIFLWELSLGLWMTFKGFRKEAPLMVEAAAEAESPHGSAPAVLSPIAVATTAGAVIRVAWLLHRALLRFSGGRVGLRAPGDKFGLLRLTTVGRRSGQPRVAIVGYYEDGPNLVTLAMNGWAEADPAWWLNLQAHPDTVAALDDGVRYVRGRAAEGDERDRLWARWVEFSDQYDGWAALRSEKTAIVVLEPRTGAEVTA
jgi:deazaflavin-dependent oxidoreductase (nitroreductase family)